MLCYDLILLNLFAVWSQCLALCHAWLKLVGFHKSGYCKIHATMEIRSYLFKLVRHVFSDYMFQSLAEHSGQRYWAVVTGHVFVAFGKVGLIFAFL